MRFTFTPLAIPDVVQIEPGSAGDERGFLAETFRAGDFAAAGIREPFVQENHARSSRGVLRGLHFQKPPRSQGKLVRCVRGRVYDVAVDLRRGSAHYGRWVGLELTEDNRRMIYIPPGFAHGFQVLSESADVLYKMTEYYSPAHEAGIRWDDPELAIAWPDREPILSPKDGTLPRLKDAPDVGFRVPA